MTRYSHAHILVAAFTIALAGVMQSATGPEATGQHCPEGWTLYPTPGPQMKNVKDPGSADFHYYNWVDQFDTFGL